MPLSGKTTLAELMKDKGYTVLDMGDVVRIEMEKRGIAAKNTGEFVNSMRDEHGMDAIAQLSMPYLNEILEEQDKIVITGMRGWSEKKRFETETGKEIQVIGIWASPETRKNRREERQRDEDIEGDSFKERDLREIDNGVGKLFSLSDHLIQNEDKNLEDLEKSLEKLI